MGEMAWRDVTVGIDTNEYWFASYLWHYKNTFSVINRVLCNVHPVELCRDDSDAYEDHPVQKLISYQRIQYTQEYLLMREKIEGVPSGSPIS